jgi:hypothetical protein
MLDLLNNAIALSVWATFYGFLALCAYGAVTGR